MFFLQLTISKSIDVLYSNGGDPCTVPKTPHGRVTYGVDTPTHDATLWPGQLHYDFDPVHLICDWEASPSNTDPGNYYHTLLLFNN